MLDELAASIRDDVERLCSEGDRDLGTSRNRAATEYVTQRMADLGLRTHVLEFEVPEWRFGRASLRAESLELELHPGPYSPGLEGVGPLRVVRRAEELVGTGGAASAAGAPGEVLLLCDEIAATQFTPRGYPFYSDPDHAAVLDALEAARPLAVIAATHKSPMTGAMSPFPLIEEVGFTVPSAYLPAEKGVELAKRAGEDVAVSIESETLPSTGQQPIGRLLGAGGEAQQRRIVVSAHVDSKPETPGALDNAAGVAVLLAVATLLRDTSPARTVEFVPFNGEDHVLAPGELAWLSSGDGLSGVTLAINIDGAGLAGGPSAYSLYGVDEATKAAAERLSQGNASVVEGPPWPASDHMIFAMQGVPAVAVTSMDFEAASGEYSHTPADTPDILDYQVLADTARFVAALIGEA